MNIIFSKGKAILERISKALEGGIFVASNIGFFMK